MVTGALRPLQPSLFKTVSYPETYNRSRLGFRHERIPKYQDGSNPMILFRTVCCDFFASKARRLLTSLAFLFAGTLGIPALAQTTQPAIVTQPVSMTVPAGQPATFEVAATGGGPLAYQWALNGAAIVGATSDTYGIPQAQLSDRGAYSVTVSNAQGSTTSTPAELTLTFAHNGSFFETWSAEASLPSTAAYDDVAYFGELVAVGADGSIMFSSPGGVKWFPAAMSLGALGQQTWGQLNSVIYLEGASFVAVGNGGAIVTFEATGAFPNTVFYPGPVSQVSGTTATLTGVAKSGSTIVSVGYGGVAVVSDLRATSWSPVQTGTNNNLNAVTFGAGQFIAVGLGGTVLVSTDGSSWVPASIGSSTDLYSITYGSGVFAAVGSGGSIYTSADGFHWTTRFSPTSITLVRAGFGGGILAAVGLDGVIETSADAGLTWAIEASGTTARLNGLAFLSGQDLGFVAVGEQGVAVGTPASRDFGITNISSRGFAGSGAQTLIAGFVSAATSYTPVQPAGQPLLIRAIGPTLAEFGVSGALAEPQLSINEGYLFGPYTSWGGDASTAQAFATFGAFPLPGNSADAAYYQNIGPLGVGTALVNGLNGTTGVALVEAYTYNYQFTNISTRAYIGTGSDILIAGFVISGTVPKTVLIRGIGPGLAQFSLSGLLANPQLSLFDADGNPLETNAGWGGSADLAAVFSRVGAFALLPDSTDCAMEVTLPPGNYTVELSGASGATGVGLVEIYSVQ